MKNDHSYEVIVIGAGIAGLTCAAYLSKNGYRTLLCEKGEKPGGLVSAFTRNGFTFDAGIRAFENSGIVLPMIKQLGIEIEFVSNPVSIGIEEQIIKLQSKESLNDYRSLLWKKFPKNGQDIDKILAEIKKTMKYMDVLYAIDNPLFLDFKEDPAYLFKTLLPWLLKYQINIRKVKKMDTPITAYLQQFTKNQALINIITQHFFKNTPAFFALSYFGLYLDYRYPIGGTGVLVDKMIERIKANHGEIALKTAVSSIDISKKQVKTRDGRSFSYQALVWCADMKTLYSVLESEPMVVQKQRKKISDQHRLIAENGGGDSVLSIYLAVNLDKDYFAEICGDHAFYTPQIAGLSSIYPKNWDEIASDHQRSAENKKAALKKWLADYLALTTYEISCPSLRDSALAPEGKTGVIVSTLLDYRLVKQIADAGWYDAFKSYCQETIAAVFDKTLFPGLIKNILDVSCSTPLTIERLTGNQAGAITGWAFTANKMPAENQFAKITRAVLTPLPDIFQAGQWTFSPSGLPVSIMTGKLAADAVSKKLKLQRAGG
ncbi:FAD-dependent oxidoreductase [Acetobacterium paludosum]|uniref:FAD-dependent oxidoreductase n=1 Tax=Acetobacterium paludosum TaxID=52693 RepID=A0A923HUX6_9FIRM|nr:NAD(P)/FAD-dependent oxidoreductase [Acetobacterium paludosum]MBC3889019.1 FAD-dependent oxidoreductase [Acetobacterium paludosum]